MKKVKQLILVGILAVSVMTGGAIQTFQYQSNATTTATKKVGTVTCTSLAMREKATKKSKIIKTIKKNTKVSVLDKTGNWYKIKYSNKRGYVYAKYLKVTTANSSADKVTGMSFEDFSKYISSVGFDEDGYFRQGNKKICLFGGDSEAIGFVVFYTNKPEFNKVFKKALAELVPTQYKKLYKIVQNSHKVLTNNDVTERTYSMDGRKVIVGEYPQGISVEFYKK